MTEPQEASTVPASAVEAEQGANPGAQAPNPAPSAATSTSTDNGEAAGAEPSTDASDDAGDAGDDAPEAGEASADGTATPGDPTRKKRRRRRRKKGGGKEGEGEGAEAQPAGEKPERPHREGAGGVFARFFDGPNAGKRHAFSAGEVVAGRVVKINDGAFVVDLFGKATAFVDVFEPHEPAPLPEPPAKAAPAPAATSVEGEGEQASVSADQISALGETAGAAAAESAFGEQPASQIADGAQTVVEGPSAPAEEPVAGASAEQVAVPESVEEYPHAVATSQFGEHEAAEEAVAADAEQHEEHHEETEAEPEPEAPPAPEVGTIFRGRIGSVAESGHVVLVNRIIDVGATKQRIVKARESRQRVRGVVYGFNRGGFDVLVDGVRVFCPASGMSLGPIENPETQLGQRLEFTVPPAKAGTHGLVVSRRGILERQQRKAAKQLFRSLQPGQRLKGRVTQVREFGLFVDLGGFEGLVHQSELSFSRGVRPQDAAQPGDEIEVQVLRVGEGQTRKERERVSLSIKSLQADPWSEHTALLEPGSIINGKVVRTTEFGAFIELAPQIEGLLHISELGRDLKHASQALEEGSEIRVVVERVDRKARRISLSKLSQAEEKSLEAGVDAKSARPPKPGASVTVVVEKIEHAGLIVQVPGVFGRRGRGFIPNVEMGTERGTDHRRGFPAGTEILAKVIGVDRDGGFRFSRKALLVDEEKQAVQNYRREAARQGLGTFGDLLRAKLEGTKTNS